MKLKQITDSIVVHTPTEEDAVELLAILHENGYAWLLGTNPIVHTYWNNIKTKTCYNIHADKKVVSYCNKDWHKHNGDTILSFSDFKRMYREEEKPQQKFEVGDCVKVSQDMDWCSETFKDAKTCFCNTPSEILEIKNDYATIKAIANGAYAVIPLKKLIPYTEPETKTAEELLTKATAADSLCAMAESEMDIIDETKEKQQGEIGNNSENSQLNLIHILKDCPIGTEFYSLIDGNVKFEGINPRTDEYGEKPIMCNEGYFCANGNYQDRPHAVCCLFPSRSLYEQYPLDPLKAWAVWAEGQKKYSLDVNLRTFDTPDTGVILKFHTPSDRGKCIEEIKAVIEKYSK